MPPALVAPAATVVTGAACCVVAAGTAGVRGVAAALLATAVVLAFFGSGIVPLLLVRGSQAQSWSGLALGVLLLTYTLRLAAVLLVLRLVSRAGAISAREFGLTVIGCALAWTATHVGLAVRRTERL